MAIAVGDEVALARAASTPTLAARGDVLFGLAIAVSAPNCTVLWQNGQEATTVPTAELDKIVGQNTSKKCVTFNDSNAGSSSEYTCAVVRAYSRDTNGAGSPVNYVLMRSLNTDIHYEAPSAAVVEVPGQ